MFNPKLIITDLDGTALTDDKTILPATIQVFSKCKKAGIPIAIATARYIKGALPYAKALGVDYMILTDGTLIFEKEKLIYSNTMTPETTSMIINELVQRNYISHIAIPTEKNLYRFPYNEKELTKSESQKQDYTPGIKLDIHSPFPYPACKIVAEFTDDKAAEDIADKCGCSQFRYRGEDRFTFFDPSASKLNAIRFLCKYLDISIIDVCCFGDDINDIEMISECGFGIAMGNAIKEVRAAADAVTGTNMNDGIANAISSYIIQ